MRKFKVSNLICLTMCVHTHVQRGFSKETLRGWRIDFVVKNSCHSCGGPWFHPQHPCGVSESFVTPVLEDSVPSSDLHRHLYDAQTYIHADKTLIHIK